MPRFRVAMAAVLVSCCGAIPAAAQAWNDARTMELVTRATERRSRQLADTGLTSYTATALGSLTFLAQVGEGFPDPPKVVKADQIALEVYWRAPNSSKQLILGRRDTLLLPTDIQYHRDHLGIVQNNFPDIIRLGEGDEVRDVPHPLSPSGMSTYDYAVGDSMRLGIPGQVIDVHEVLVRPRDEFRAAVVGAVYLARSDAQVVRMALSFTRAALIDRQLEDVAVVLDNALIEGRFWLPRRQEIEIRRSGTWLDFPARGIIRGGWEICCYEVNSDPAASLFVGPEIQLAPAERRARFTFEGPTESIVPPELATVTSTDVARVQARARDLVRERALAPVRSGSVLAGSVSELVRVNRAEGLSLGAGARLRPGPVLALDLRVRYGVSDERLKAFGELSWSASPTLSLALAAFDEVQDASDFAEGSVLRNSIATQEFAADFTEPYRLRGVRTVVRWRGAMASTPRTTVSAWHEWADPLPVAAAPARGTLRQTPMVESQASWRGAVRLEVPRRSLWGGTIEGRASMALRLEDGDVERTTGRMVLEARYARPLSTGRLVVESLGGATSSVLAQDGFFAGGPVTGPGYGLHQFSGSSMLSQRVEWQFAVPFPSVPLGRWGRTPGEARMAAYATAAFLRTPGDGPQAWPAVGVALIPFFDLLRVDVARGLREGRWRLAVDLSRDLWPIL